MHNELQPAATPEQHHVVGSMRLDVRLSDAGAARTVQEALSQLTHRRLLAEMETLFSKVCAHGHTLRLDQLVIDLGVLRPEHLEADIIERFIPRLQQSLEAALAAGPPQESADPALAALVKLLEPDAAARILQYAESPDVHHHHRQPLLKAGDALYIDNAGLVILAPFFSRYHEVNGLLVDGKFRDAAAAEHAVHLLQALITHDNAVPEQALVLNKVLCGLSPATPAKRTIDLTEEERTCANTLLQSAIQNWPGVSPISIDGFRGSFLCRRGKLTRGEDRWRLTIERRGYDVLMSSLPWSFSVIKPLWMPDPLYVDWV